MRKIRKTTVATALSGIISTVAALPAYALDTGAVDIETPFENIGEMVGVMLQALMFIAGLAAFGFLLLGGLQFITSGGDKFQAEAARNKITYALIGLAIIAGAFAIGMLLEGIFGIPILSGAELDEVKLIMQPGS